MKELENDKEYIFKVLDVRELYLVRLEHRFDYDVIRNDLIIRFIFENEYGVRDIYTCDWSSSTLIYSGDWRLIVPGDVVKLKQSNNGKKILNEIEVVINIEK